VLFAVALGVAYGGIIALAPAVVAELLGTSGLGAALGILFTAAGLGGLIGPPAIGALIDGIGYRAGISAALVVAMAAWMVVTRTNAGAPLLRRDLTNNLRKGSPCSSRGELSS